jgi:hypothetical protein
MLGGSRERAGIRAESLRGQEGATPSVQSRLPPGVGRALEVAGRLGGTAVCHEAGTGLRWHLAAGPMAGNARVYLDAAYLGTVDLYGPSLTLVTLGKTGLALDTYTVSIEVAGTKNPSSTGYLVDIDALEAAP